MTQSSAVIMPQHPHYQESLIDKWSAKSSQGDKRIDSAVTVILERVEVHSVWHALQVPLSQRATEREKRPPSWSPPPPLKTWYYLVWFALLGSLKQYKFLTVVLSISNIYSVWKRWCVDGYQLPTLGEGELLQWPPDTRSNGIWESTHKYMIQECPHRKIHGRTGSLLFETQASKSIHCISK